ncbi:MAG TPA: ribonucleoside-diphosphate reductase, adenosylcobalamin-dependent, partial [Chromatiales bacterium]|nr:ribonucleoside-diphosphate reductase, adenosylcobalamin-dependent [Chromatiales bacterium]
SNAGALEHKPATSTINCTVSGTIHDSMNGILEKVHEAGLTLKAGCGIGYEFSTLRPRGAYVSGAGAHTSGPLSFMDIYDKMCFTVSSAGGRRGAQMATFDVGHPDVMDFIRAKREDGRLRQFNLSLLITDEFMQAVKNDADWQLAFPLNEQEADAEQIDLDDPEQVVWREWPSSEGYVRNKDGLVACRVYKTIRARRLWDLIMSSTYDFAEPGFILIDKVNEMNNNWFCENIRATNPCGEQPLPPYGSCLLGSVNLTRFVRKPFTHEAEFDWDEYRKVVDIFTRMLDNVVEINGLPLEGQRDEILGKRRHGMGFLGLGSTLTMLRKKYGSHEAVEFTEQVSKELALQGWRTALKLAQEKGPAPIMEQDFTVTAEMLRKRPEMREAGYRVGSKVKGKVLHTQYSRYMQQVAKEDPELVAQLAEHGA